MESRSQECQARPFCGFRDEGYGITILGVPYPCYGEEFPHHREAYEKQFAGDDAEEQTKQNKAVIESARTTHNSLRSRTIDSALRYL